MNYTTNNTNPNNLYNNYNNMKITKPNNDKYSNNLNKTFNSSYVNSSFKTNSNNSNNKKKRNFDKKLSQYAAKINNYYNKYQLNNSELKGFQNKYSKNNFERLNQKRSSIPIDNNLFNFNKYLNSANKNQTIYKPKKEGNKTNFYNQLNIISSTIKNNNVPTERNRPYSITNKNFSSNKVLSVDNIVNSYSEIKEKKDKIIKIFKNNKKITSKEESFYILATSPVLRLNEQLIFSRATKNIRNVLPINNILKNHNIFLNAKANELQNEIKLCEKRIKASFVASKIADINLNFITSNDEQEFRDFDIFETNQYVINEYYNYIKLLLILLNGNYDNNLNGQQLKERLFEKLKEKNFIYVKDYLYYIYIGKKEEFKVVEKIDIINELLKISPKIINFNETLKICKFAAFSNYLIKEIITYANNLKDTIELKYRAENLLDIVMEKIDKMKKKSTSTLKSAKKNSYK